MNRLKLKKLLIVTLLSTATLFAGFQTVDCTNQTHLDTLKLPQVECEILDAFWDAMGNGAGWTDDAGWDTLTYADTWSGVYMHDDNSSIKMFGWGTGGNNITGELPTELENFIALEGLGFADNNLYGTIPKNIKELTTLVQFLVYNNNFSGSLPDFSKMPNLRYVQTHDNHFTFSDIEPQINLLKGLYSFAASPQAPIDESAHKVVYFNENIPLVIEPTLAPNTSGNDKYTWYHASTTADTESTLDYNQSRIYTKLQPTVTDEGYYSYGVSNIEFANAPRAEQRLYLHSTIHADAIHAVYNHAPSVSNIPTTLVETQVDTTYTYTPNAEDADQDTLSFSIVSKPTWALFDTTTGELSGTPTQSDIADYNISIAVSDGKQTSDINYTLKVLPKDLEPQTPIAPVNNIYKHSETGNTIATALTNPQLNLYFDNLNERAMFLEDNYCSTSTYHAYIGFPYNGGQLYTGYLKCGSNEVFKSTVLNNLYPDGSIATLLNEPSTNKAMIMIDIPLTDTTPSVTIGAD